MNVSRVDGEKEEMKETGTKGTWENTKKTGRNYSPGGDESAEVGFLPGDTLKCPLESGHRWVGEIAQWLRALVALSEDPSSVTSTSISWVYNSCSRESDTSDPESTSTYTYKQTQII